MDLQLSGKTAVVTGGSRGIGKAIAFQLAREGVDVVVAARDKAMLEAAAAEIAEATGRRVLPVPVDTGSEASVRAMVDAAMAAFGRIDILSNNAAKAAGRAAPPKLAELTDDVFWDDVNVKVMGYLRCAREVAPHMKKSGWGRIINNSGLAARSTGNIVGSIRNVSVASLTKNLADELGRFGINVTCVHPKLTRTEATPAVVARQSREQGVPEAEIERRMASTAAIGRLITAEEVADVVAFLASPRSVAINGDAIAVGGGHLGAIHY